MEFSTFKSRSEEYIGYSYDAADFNEEYGLCMRYDSDCRVTLGENEYLVDAPLMVTNMDADGNEISITKEVVTRAARFLTAHETVIEVDGEAFPAIRLTD